MEDGYAMKHCPICGFQFFTARDERRHEAICKKYRAAIKALRYRPRIYSEREALKTEGWTEILEGDNLAVRVAGAEKVLRAWFDRSLQTAIFNGYWPNHPKFEEYAAMMLEEKVNYIRDTGMYFPKEVVDALIEKYGSQFGIPSGSYWYPKSFWKRYEPPAEDRTLIERIMLLLTGGRKRWAGKRILAKSSVKRGRKKKKSLGPRKMT